MRFIKKFIRAIRGTDKLDPRPLPEYPFIIMLVERIDELENHAQPVEYIDGAPVVQYICKKHEYSETFSKVYAAGKPGQYVLVLDSWSNQQHWILVS